MILQKYKKELINLAISAFFVIFARKIKYMRKTTPLIIGIIVLLLHSCGDYAKVTKTTDSSYRYEAAKGYYAVGHYNRAAELLNDLIIVTKGTEKGEECLYLLAMANYNGKNYDAAATTFQRYYQSYPRGLYTEEARFYAGKAMYENTPEPRLDQTDTYNAVTEFSNFIEAYPTSKYRQQAQDYIFELQDKLVEKEYLNAKLYYDLGGYFLNCTNGGNNYQACVITAQNAIKDYPYCKRREDLSILILKAKFELAKNSVASKQAERYQDAIDEFYGFQTEYPESAFMPKAQEMYEHAKKYESHEE